MQKVLRRSLLARNQAIKKARDTEHKNWKKENHEFHRDRIMKEKAIRGYVKTERKTRREDWLLGPLAPQRDVGVKKGVYGTMDPFALRDPTIPIKQRAAYINFAVGDRVCIFRGREKGRIGRIVTINEEQEMVDVEGMNPVDQALPDYYRGTGDQRRPPFQEFNMPIPINDIRLVMTESNLDTGEKRDVIIRHMRGGEPVVEREYGEDTPKHTRYIEGSDEEIPWPDARPEDFHAEDCDTLRMTVEERTFVPSILAPFPESIMDELRNPFHKLRSRHDNEWVEGKLKEDALEAWQSRRRLLTPKTEYFEHQVKERRQPQDTEPSLDLLQLIREVQNETLDSRTPSIRRAQRIAT